MIQTMMACQARAARAILMWSVRRLAAKSKISDSSIRRIETSNSTEPGVSIDLLVRLQQFFESQGFTFTWDQTAGPGVSCRRNPGRWKERRVGERRRAGGTGK